MLKSTLIRLFRKFYGQKGVAGTWKNGKVHPTPRYRIKTLIENARLRLALSICPHLKDLKDRIHWEREGRIHCFKEWQRDVRGKEKGIRRLQKKNKELIKQLGDIK